jgi:hypothetical protein
MQLPVRHIWFVPHGVLSATFCGAQEPVAGAQTLVLHGSVLGAQTTGLPLTHSPFWQVSACVQASPSLQEVPFGLLV